VSFIWECQYKKLLIDDSNLLNFRNIRNNYYKDIKDYGHASLRESFFGGRTNNFLFNYKCQQNKSLKYYDFTSLYPHVLVDNNYPIGHPNTITENFSDVDNYFGFIKCIIIPPKQLYIPVLPLKIDDKLCFPLCFKCAKLRNSANCNH